MHKGVEDFDISRSDVGGIVSKACLWVVPGAGVEQAARIWMIGDTPMEIAFGSVVFVQ